MQNFRNFISEEVKSKTSKLLLINVNVPEQKAALKKEFKDLVSVDWEDVVIDSGKIVVKKQSIDEFSFVFVGTVGTHSSLCSVLEAYLTKNAIGNLFYGSASANCNKPLQSVLLNNFRVPQIKTIIGNTDKVKANDLIKTLGLPIVSKIIHGSQGKGIAKHDTKESLTKYLNDTENAIIIFQSFVPNDGDIRAFFFKNKMIYSIIRKSSSDKEFRNNTSLGGNKEQIELDKEAKAIALKAHQIMKFDFSGVDLIQDKNTKQWYVMEINAAPQYFGDPYFNLVMDEVKSYIHNHI